MSESKTGSSMVRTAGRGVIYITLAKLWFLLTGYALIFGLPRILKWSAGGDEEAGQALFGAYKIVFMGVSFINNGIITGIIQSVSKFTSEDESSADAVKRSALKIQGTLGVAIALIYVAFAGVLANVLGSPELAYLFRLSAGVIAAYSCYAVFIGSFNGKMQFNRQAAFDVVYATVKTCLILGLAAAGFEVLGTVMGFLGASIVIAIAAFFVAGLGARGTFPARRYLPFAATLFLYTFVLNLVMSLDLFLLKGITASLAVESGMTQEAASLASKTLTGQYGGAQGLAFIPYQAIISIAFVAFPMISKVTFADDTQKTRAYVRKTLRMSTILIVGLAAVFAALPTQSLGLIFEPEYKVASDALGILSLGIAAFGVIVVSNTILNASGNVWRSMLVVGLTLLAVVVGVVVMVRHVGFGPESLAATATGTAVGMGIGLVISGISVYRRFGTFWPLLTVLRVCVAAGIMIAVGRFLLPDAGKLVTLAECLLVFVSYFVLLIVFREFKKEDLVQLKEVLRRGKKKAD